MLRLLAMACALLAALAGSGCGRTAGSGSGTTIVWATLKDETGIEHRLAADYETSHPGIHVNIIEMPASTDTQHNQYATYLISEDDSIDLYSIDVIWPAEFGSAGWARPLDDVVPPAERARFLRGPIQACTYRGHLYAIPWYTDAGLLYYRKDLLSAAGLAPPRTWSELVRAAQRLQHGDRDGYLYQGAEYEGLICTFLELVWGNGGRVLDDAGRVVLDTSKNVQALQFLIDTVNQYHITPGEVRTYKEDECLQAFRAGKAALMRNWPYVWGLTQRSGEPLLGKVGIEPVPHSDTFPHSAATLGGWNLMVSRYSRHPTEAVAVARFLTSEVSQKRRFMEASELPTREAVYTDPEVLAQRPYARDFLHIFRLSRPRPVTPYYSRLSDIMQIQVHKALSGEIDAATALRRAQAQIVQIPGFTGGP